MPTFHLAAKLDWLLGGARKRAWNLEVVSLKALRRFISAPVAAIAAVVALVFSANPALACHFGDIVSTCRQVTVSITNAMSGESGTVTFVPTGGRGNIDRTWTASNPIVRVDSASLRVPGITAWTVVLYLNRQNGPPQEMDRQSLAIPPLCPTPTPTPSATPTPRPSATPSHTPTPTPRPSASATPTPTPSATPSATPPPTVRVVPRHSAAATGVKPSRPLAA